MTNANTDALVEREAQDAFTRALSNLKGTFSFERKVNLGDYESVTASCFVQFDYPPDCDGLDEWLPLAQEAASRAMSIVYGKLGIEVELDAGGTLREVSRAFPGARIEASQGVSTASADAAAMSMTHERPDGVMEVAPAPPFSQEYLRGLPKGSDELKQARKQNAVWAAARWETHPNEFYDNQPKKREDPAGWGNSPDYTHKKSKAGFYVD